MCCILRLKFLKVQLKKALNFQRFIIYCWKIVIKNFLRQGTVHKVYFDEF